MVLSDFIYCVGFDGVQILAWVPLIDFDFIEDFLGQELFEFCERLDKELFSFLDVEPLIGSRLEWISDLFLQDIEDIDADMFDSLVGADLEVFSDLYEQTLRILLVDL